MATPSATANFQKGSRTTPAVTKAAARSPTTCRAAKTMSMP